MKFEQATQITEMHKRAAERTAGEGRKGSSSSLCAESLLSSHRRLLRSAETARIKAQLVRYLAPGGAL
ncbi:hypothetical protein MTO96_029833 [Rhipicephalus appendiculatus]